MSPDCESRGTLDLQVQLLVDILEDFHVDYAKQRSVFVFFRQWLNHARDLGLLVDRRGKQIAEWYALLVALINSTLTDSVS